MTEQARVEPRIRVYLCDDHHIVREGIKRLLATAGDMDVVGEAADGEEAIEQIPLLKPDVVLMDIRMPRRDGVAVTAAIRQILPNVRVLALSTYVDDDLVFGAIRAGATGYLAKDVEPERLLAAIRAAAEGRSVISGELIEKVVRRIQSRDQAPGEAVGIERLTNQELTILELVSEGLTNSDIAEKLCLSVKTVKSHLSHIFGKLDVSNRAQAASVFVRATNHRLERD